jgi:hypothetical protein
MRPHLVPLRHTALLLALLLAASASASTPRGDGRQAPPASLPQLQTPAPTGRIVLQYAPGATSADRTRIAALAGATPRSRIAPRLLDTAASKARTPIAALEALGRYAQVDATGLERPALLKLVARLAADPAVATAFLEPRAVPAALGFDAFTGRGPASAAPATGDAPPAKAATTTPDFSLQQGYLDAAPLGVGIRELAGTPGVRGGTVRVIDVEGAWLWDHEDLPAPFADLGAHIDDLSWRNHGTAVLGQIRGIDNGLGVEGLVPDAEVGASSIGNQSFPEALLAAASVLEAGDIVLIELHAPGPNSFGNGSQFGYVPMEFWQDNFDAIRALTDLGIIVVEAAGNGQQDLDDPVYLGLFDRQVRDSGAIMVGASDGSATWPAWFTNHGSRVDLSGWGEDVVTCGYGDLQEGEETAWYTERFAGTSSASPIVVGAVAALQGTVESAWGFSLDAPLARTLLRQTGTAMSGDQQIGPRPDVVAAWELVGQQGIGMIDGTVVETGSGAPVAGARVRLLPDGPLAITDAAGAFRLGVLPGAHDLEVTSYFHETFRDWVVVGTGLQPLDLALEARPLVTITGTVADTAGEPVAGARVEAIAEPLAPALTGADGGFAIPGAPVGPVRTLQAGGAPGLGGAIVEIPGGVSGPVLHELTLPPVTWDFEDGPSGFTTIGTVWQRSLPAGTPLGDGAAFDGQWAWGVGFGGPYPDQDSGYLTSPALQGADFAGDRLYLSFHYWTDTEPGFDGMNVGVSTGGAVTPRQPVAGYTDVLLGGLGYAPGWSGDSGGWRTAVVDLTDMLGVETWHVVWRFGSDFAVNGTGVLIDGVAVAAVDLVVAAPTPGAPAATAVLAAWPNPFNPRVNLAWELAAPGIVDLAIYDLRGRAVRELLHAEPVTASGHVLWDGADDRGRPVPSGVYLVRLRPADGAPVTQRITLAR